MTAMPPAEISHGVLDGPWDQALWFELPGTLRSKSNARRFTNSPQERTAYDRQKSFAVQVTMLGNAARPSDWQTGAGLPFAQQPQMVAVVLARTVLDATNVPKSLHDALQVPVLRAYGVTVVGEGGLFADDNQIRCAVQQTARGKTGGGIAAFARLPADANQQQVAAAAAALHAAVLTLADGAVPGFESA
jgi:hypothetical protein